MRTLTLNLNALPALDAPSVGSDAILLRGSCLDLESNGMGVGVVDLERLRNEAGEGACMGGACNDGQVECVRGDSARSKEKGGGRLNDKP